MFDKLGMLAMGSAENIWQKVTLGVQNHWRLRMLGIALYRDNCHWRILIFIFIVMIRWGSSTI